MSHSLEKRKNPKSGISGFPKCPKMSQNSREFPNCAWKRRKSGKFRNISGNPGKSRDLGHFGHFRSQNPGAIWKVPKFPGFRHFFARFWHIFRISSITDIFSDLFSQNFPEALRHEIYGVPIFFKNYFFLAKAKPTPFGLLNGGAFFFRPYQTFSLEEEIPKNPVPYDFFPHFWLFRGLLLLIKINHEKPPPELSQGALFGQKPVAFNTDYPKMTPKVPNWPEKKRDYIDH